MLGSEGSSWGRALWGVAGGTRAASRERLVAKQQLNAALAFRLFFP